MRHWLKHIHLTLTYSLDAYSGADAVGGAVAVAGSDTLDVAAAAAAAAVVVVCVQAQEEADQGWTLVQKSGAKADHSGGAQPVSRAGKRNKKDKTELQNFYRHQKMEAQQNRVAQLRRKFDEDSQRMEHMRGARKFRPY